MLVEHFFGLFHDLRNLQETVIIFVHCHEDVRKCLTVRDCDQLRHDESVDDPLQLEPAALLL